MLIIHGVDETYPSHITKTRRAGNHAVEFTRDTRLLTLAISLFILVSPPLNYTRAAAIDQASHTKSRYVPQIHRSEMPYRVASYVSILSRGILRDALCRDIAATVYLREGVELERGERAAAKRWKQEKPRVSGGAAG